VQRFLGLLAAVIGSCPRRADVVVIFP
jgi:hypothetical protein